MNGAKIVLAAVLVAVVFGAGLYSGTVLQKSPNNGTISENGYVFDSVGNSTVWSVDNADFEPANVTIQGNDLTLISGCRQIDFNVTDDQAYSIHSALVRMPVARPLTHDLMKDIIDNFNVSVRTVRIERFGEDIYYARMFLQQNDRILDVDLRPSDAVAIALRTGSTLYVNSTMMAGKGAKIC